MEMHRSNQTNHQYFYKIAVTFVYAAHKVVVQFPELFEVCNKHFLFSGYMEINNDIWHISVLIK